MWFFSSVHGAVAIVQFSVYSEFTLIQAHSEQKRHSVIPVLYICEVVTGGTVVSTLLVLRGTVMLYLKVLFLPLNICLYMVFILMMQAGQD